MPKSRRLSKKSARPKRPDCGLRRKPMWPPRRLGWRRRHRNGSVCSRRHAKLLRHECRLRRRPRSRRRSGISERKRRISWWSETSTRWGALLGSGPHGDGFSCCHRTPPEVQRRRRGCQALPVTRERGTRRPLRRFGGRSQGSSANSVTRRESLAGGAR